MALRIAVLHISIGDSGILYNRAEDLKTDKTRGTTLEDGKIVRGLGTSFESKEAKERYDRLVSRSNEIRAQFGMRFGRGPIRSTYMVAQPGDAIRYGETFESDAPDITVTVDELDTSGSLSERALADWAEANKELLKRVPLGRSEEASDEGLTAIETLASCPAFAQETKDVLQRWVSEAKVGSLKRADLKRNISLLDVKMDATPLMVPRSRPAMDPAPTA